MWLLFQPADERAPLRSYVKVVDPDEQEKAVCQAWHNGDLSTRDVRGHPTREGKRRALCCSAHASILFTSGNEQLVYMVTSRTIR
jgi:hypothetical protein